MVNKHTKRCSTSLLEKRKPKSDDIVISYPLGWLIKKKKITTESVAEDVEKLEPFILTEL